MQQGGFNVIESLHVPTVISLTRQAARKHSVSAGPAAVGMFADNPLSSRTSFSNTGENGSLICFWVCHRSKLPGPVTNRASPP